MQQVLLFAAAALLMCISTNAEARCRWTFDCSSGPCRQVQLCDSTLDMPTIRPPAVAPIAPPSIPPIGTPAIPPLGTSSCAPNYLCNSLGQCAWRTVCR